ncbi:hypothetical protein ACU8V3_02775 [Cobetia marina]
MAGLRVGYAVGDASVSSMSRITWKMTP